MKILAHVLALSIIFIMMLSAAFAEVYSYEDGENVIGYVQTYEVKDRESLIEIARKFDLGYNEIIAANPELDPFVPGNGVSVGIPTSWILPDVITYEGIVINLSEMRLFYFFNLLGSRLVMTFPIGIGSEGYDTPVGNFRVIEKTINPSWYVPESIRKEKPYLPKVMPPGSDNPLGSHALRLSLGTILIHGTNKPWGVGRKISHGCIRLYPEDIPRLFQLVSNGAKVTIVRQPIKVGMKGKRVFIEVNNDPEVDRDYFHEAVELLKKKNLFDVVSTERLLKALNDKTGIPLDISNQ
jgi:L,D-transpeptidase ErfK/SrfK